MSNRPARSGQQGEPLSASTESIADALATASGDEAAGLAASDETHEPVEHLGAPTSSAPSLDDDDEGGEDARRSERAASVEADEENAPPSLLRVFASARRRGIAALHRWREQAQAWWAAEKAQGVREPGFQTRVAGLPVAAWLALLTLLGLGVRLYYFSIQGGFHYPDELFQYLEPAYWRLHGHAHLTWEYDRGVRNWILPAYYGALMELGEAAGYHGWELHRLLLLHNALFSLLLVPAGWRLGVAVGRGDVRLGLLSAAAMAAFPLFGYFAPHTLSELHGLVITTWAYALWHEQVWQPERHGALRKALLVGLLLGAAIITRYTLVVAVPLVFVDYNFRGRFKQFFALCLGFGIAMALLGVVDKLTWGKALGSFIEYVKYNLIEDGASDHGVMAKSFYWDEAFVARLGFSRWLLLVPGLLVFWRHWRLILGWLIPLYGFTTIDHKEERFLLSIWPFVLVAALSGWLFLLDLSRFVPPLYRWRPRRALIVVAATALLALVCWHNFHGVAKLPMRWKAGIFQAQTWVGRQADATGLLYEDRRHLNGGWFLLDRGIPQDQFNFELLRNPLFNYVAVYGKRTVDALRARADFEAVLQVEDVTVFRRRSGLLDASASEPPAPASRH